MSQTVILERTSCAKRMLLAGRNMCSVEEESWLGMLTSTSILPLQKKESDRWTAPNSAANCFRSIL